MGARRERLDLRLRDQKVTRVKNSQSKCKERARRDQRMIEYLRTAPSGPYPPHVESWLTKELGKKARQITEADLKDLLTPS